MYEIPVVVVFTNPTTDSPVGCKRQVCSRYPIVLTHIGATLGHEVTSGAELITEFRHQKSPILNFS